MTMCVKTTYGISFITSNSMLFQVNFNCYNVKGTWMLGYLCRSGNIPSRIILTDSITLNLHLDTEWNEIHDISMSH